MPKPRRQLPLPVQLLLAVALIVALAYFGMREREGNDPPAAGTSGGAAPSAPATKSAAVIKNVTLRDRDGKIIYRGDVDLSRTIARIKSGKSLAEFRNDGSVFQNRERRLPRKAEGYYREWVHPTPKLLPSPGPQRIVTGQAGEFYYTPDHYGTFQRLDVGGPDRP